MAINLLNRAEVVYNYGDMSDSATSNQTNTVLLEQYTMSVTKTAVDDSIRPGSDAVYVVRVENNGSGSLYNVTLTDNLGGTPDRLLYIEDTAQFYLNGVEIAGNVNAVEGDVFFTVTVPLQPGDNLMVIYAATVSENAVEPVVNTVTAQANSGTSAGPTISDTAQETVNISPFASVAIVKTADRDTVVAGDTLVYTFTLLNNGNAAVDSLVFTDSLPEEFAVTSVTYTVNGETTLLEPSDYNVGVDNTVTIPDAESAVVIGIPASDVNGPGVATIVITGTVA